MISQTAITLASLLTDITSIITEGVSWIQQMIQVIVGQPLLLLFTLFGFVGAGIGLIKRVLRL